MCCPVKALSILECQMTSRKLQASTTSHHLQHTQIFSQQHKSINTSSTTESRHSVGRNNQQPPQKPWCTSKPMSKYQQAYHCYSLPSDFQEAMGKSKVLITAIVGSFERWPQKTGSLHFSHCFKTDSYV